MQPIETHILQLSDFQNIHSNKPIIVCGCGASLNEFKNHQNFITIGVNDVGRLFTPTYLVVLNPPQQFKNGRFKYVQGSKAETIFTQLDLRLNHPNVVHFKLGQRGGTNFSNPNVLHHTQNSPYVALCLAAHMGAKRIGIIGVDFTDHHFFGNTGRHKLAGKISQIDREYHALGKALSRQGITVINLSRQSRLTAFPKGKFDDLVTKQSDNIKNESSRKRKIFFINYKFLSCGDVFRHGLNHAAVDLGIEFAEAYWDDLMLPSKINHFKPDLIFVVHGRKFTQKWGSHFKNYNTAVWLLDEPYEVDDTSTFSGLFDTVFVNDPNTINRHKNAHYLPVCYDPYIYYDEQKQRKYDVGFIGGYNSVRQKLFDSLCSKGLLSYVVGGPWKSKALNNICLSRNIPASETALLYKQTRIVINIFREVHHFNRQKIPAFSLNPRIYEAIACNTLVVSENRPEIQQIFPELPVFKNDTELVAIVAELLNNSEKFDQFRNRCVKRLEGHRYLDRLKCILNICLTGGNKAMNSQIEKQPLEPTKDDIKFKKQETGIFQHWEDYGNIIYANENSSLILRKKSDMTPGSEKGLVSEHCYENISLTFEVKVQENTCFVAKILQEDKYNQKSNSYHLMYHNRSSYFARHNHIFKNLNLNPNSWEKVKLMYEDGNISVYKNDSLLFHIIDNKLKKGYAFLGIKKGEVHLKNININANKKTHHISTHPIIENKNSEYNVLHLFQTSFTPVVSIITTVYDRVTCLRNCIKSVKNLNFKDCEHIIVADSPPESVIEKIKLVIQEEDIGRIEYANLKRRFNNWGIAPASVGLNLARGKYVCFLSDDNGYTPDHVNNLVEELERNLNLGFVYSSCRYGGRRLLKSPVPKPARIDLGQPMFRRVLFERYLQNKLPFKSVGWDWQMINHFIKSGVKWKHIDKLSFIFQLEKYPQLMAK